MRTFAAFLGLILVGFAAIALFSYPVWIWLHPHYSFPFHRMGERIGMLALLVGLVLVARPLRLDDRASLGFGLPRRRFVREMGLGLLLGSVTMALVLAAMTALGLLGWAPAATLGTAALVKLVGARLASGVAVAFIEETFLRGAMLTGIERESGARTAIVLTSLVYAATHFFASYHIAPDAVTAHSGWELVAGTLHAFADPLAIADAFLCLFAVGVVLAVIRVTTGNLAAGLGLHAGWVWVMLVAHELTQPLRTAPLGFLLSRSDGFTGWLVLAWAVVLGFGLQRFYARRTAEARRSAEPPCPAR